MKWLKRILATAVLLGVASTAHAVNSIVSVTTKKWPNLTTAAIKSIVSGDDDSSSVHRTFVTTPADYRENGNAAFDSGVVMARCKHLGNNRVHDGIIMWLTPGTKYYYRVDYDDEDGGSGITAIDSFTTRSIPNPTYLTTVYVANGPFGNDLNPGTNDNPKGTIAGALTALYALPNKGAGCSVGLYPGIYREKVIINDGTDAAGVYRALRGIGDGDSVIIDLSLEQTLELTWTLYGNGTDGGNDSTYYAIVPRTTIKDSVSLVVLGWDELIHRKLTKTELFACALGERSGWVFVEDTLFLRRNWRAELPLANPGTVRVNLGYHWNRAPAIMVHKRNWIFQNLTIRFNGALIGTEAHGIQFGEGSNNASGCVVNDVHFYGLSGRATYAPLFGGGGRGDSLMLVNNRIRGIGVGHMNYDAAKSRQEEQTVILHAGTFNNTFYNNIISDSHNGIQPAVGGFTADSTLGSAYEISYNTIYELSDDGIELDTGHGIGSVVYNNTVHKVNAGISLAPILRGPLYITHNRLSNFAFTTTINSRAFKIGFTHGDGQVFLYHNSTRPNLNTSSGQAAVTHVGGPSRNMTWANNIFQGRVNRVITHDLTADLTNVTYNYNLYDSLGGGAPRMMIENSTSYSTRATPAATASSWNTTFARDNDSRVGSVAYADSIVELTLSGSSPAINNGRRITGINTDHVGNRYNTAPDIGAVEYQWSGHQTGRRRRWWIFQSPERVY